MFGIGFGELLIILLVALLVLGPEQLPSVARSLGRAFGDFRRAADELRSSVDKELRETKETLAGPLKKERDEIRALTAAAVNLAAPSQENQTVQADEAKATADGVKQNGNETGGAAHGS